MSLTDSTYSQSNMESAYFTVKSLAQYLGVTEKYIRTLTYEGKLTYYKAFGKNLYKREYIEKILNESMIPSTSQIITEQQ